MVNSEWILAPFHFSLVLNYKFYYDFFLIHDIIINIEVKIWQEEF